MFEASEDRGGVLLHALIAVHHIDHSRTLAGSCLACNEVRAVAGPGFVDTETDHVSALATGAESAPAGGFAGPLELTRLVRTTAAACADATALVAEVRTTTLSAESGHQVHR